MGAGTPPTAGTQAAFSWQQSDIIDNTNRFRFFIFNVNYNIRVMNVIMFSSMILFMIAPPPLYIIAYNICSLKVNPHLYILIAIHVILFLSLFYFWKSNFPFADE